MASMNSNNGNGNVRQIPGFYFDPEKGKYFKVQPHHKVPQGVKYSREKVMATGRADAKRKRDSKSSYKPAVAIRRPAGWAESPLNQLMLRELGVVKPLDLAHFKSSVFAKELGASGPSWVFRGNLTTLQPGYPVVQRFAWDRATRRWIIGAETNLRGQSGYEIIIADMEQPFAATSARHIDKRSFSAITTVALGGFLESRFSSVLVTPSRTCLTSSVEGPVVSFRLPADYDVHGALHADLLWATSVVRPSLAPLRPFLPVWSVAHSSTWNLFGICAQDGVFLHHEANLSPSGPPVRSWPSDVFRMEFFEDSHCFASGRRSGILEIHDMRDTRSHVSQTGHPGAIVGIKKLQGNGLVVCGLNDRMCTYDIRTMRPYMEFKAYHNDCILPAGIAVNEDYGVLAAVANDPACPVQVFSLDSGKELKTGLPPHVVSVMPEQIEFVVQRDGAQPSLVMAASDMLMSFDYEVPETYRANRG